MLKQRVAALLANPATSWWLREAVNGGLSRDPVDALRDAVTLVAILKEHCANVHAAATRTPTRAEVKDAVQRDHDERLGNKLGNGAGCSCEDDGSRHTDRNAQRLFSKEGK